MICKHCGHDHEAWPAEAARCDQRRVTTLTAENKDLKGKVARGYKMPTETGGR